MTSITEKILLIGAGAVICISLFSILHPLFSNLQRIDHDLSARFNNFVFETRKAAQMAHEKPGEEFLVCYNFSEASFANFMKYSGNSLHVEVFEKNRVLSELIIFGYPLEIQCNPCFGQNLKEGEYLQENESLHILEAYLGCKLTKERFMLTFYA